MNRVDQTMRHQERSWRSPSRANWLAGLVLALLVALVYWPTLGNGFVSDDQADIESNLLLRTSAGLFDLWFRPGVLATHYPLTFTSFWAEYHLWGLDPRPYHALNLLLHATAAILVWRLLKRLAVPGAWLAAAIFAVHPVEVESVAWIAERKNVLSLTLALASMLAYWRYAPPGSPVDVSAGPSPRGSRVDYALALLFFVAALLSKTAVVCVPAVILVVCWWKRGRLAWRDVAPTVPLFALSLAFAGMTLWVESIIVSLHGASEEFSFSLVDRVLIAGRALWFYAGKLAWPHPLVFFYPRWTIDSGAWWQYLFPLTAAAALAILWATRARTGRGPLAAVLIYVGVLLPTLGFFNVYLFRYSFVADHLQYHASVAICALAASSAVLIVGRGLPRARWLGQVGAASFLLALAVLAQQRTHVFRDQLTLDQDIVARDPGSWVGNHNLGVWFRDRARYKEAIPHYQHAAEIVAVLASQNPHISRYRNGLAAALVDIGSSQLLLGRMAEAEASFRKAMAIREQLLRDYPGDPGFEDDLAWCYAKLGVTQRHFGRLGEAMDLQQRALALREKLAREHPADPKYQDEIASSAVDIGLLCRDLARPLEAEQAFGRVIEIRERIARERPADSLNLDSLAWSQGQRALSLRSLGRGADAQAAQLQSIEIRQRLSRDNPSNVQFADNVAGAYVDLGLLERDLGHPAKAQAAFRQALEIRAKLVAENPAVTAYQDGLAWCHVHLAHAEQDLGHSQAAEASCRAATEIRRNLAEANPDADDYQARLAQSWRDLGTVQYDSGAAADALVSFREAISIRQELARRQPSDPPRRADWGSDLALGGDALALLGRWSESAELYAQAVGYLPNSAATRGRWALLQLAAGNEAGYRAVCSELERLPENDVALDTAFLIAVALLSADNRPGDTAPALAIAAHASQNDRASRAAKIVAAVAQYRATPTREAAERLGQLLAEPDADPAAARRGEIMIARLLAETTLAQRDREAGDRASLDRRLAALNALVATASELKPRARGSLPAWAVASVAAITRRELTRLGESL